MEKWVKLPFLVPLSEGTKAPFQGLAGKSKSSTYLTNLCHAKKGHYINYKKKVNEKY